MLGGVGGMMGGVLLVVYDVLCSRGEIMCYVVLVV